MTDQDELSRIFVEALRQKGLLEDVISEHENKRVRVCSHCQRLMSEGWIYQRTETYCSDQCLQAAHPELDIEQLRQHAEEEESETYWTHWEG